MCPDLSSKNAKSAFSHKLQQLLKIDDIGMLTPNP